MVAPLVYVETASILGAVFLVYKYIVDNRGPTTLGAKTVEVKETGKHKPLPLHNLPTYDGNIYPHTRLHYSPVVYPNPHEDGAFNPLLITWDRRDNETTEDFIDAFRQFPRRKQVCAEGQHPYRDRFKQMQYKLRGDCALDDMKMYGTGLESRAFWMKAASAYK